MSLPGLLRKFRSWELASRAVCPVLQSTMNEKKKIVVRKMQLSFCAAEEIIDVPVLLISQKPEFMLKLNVRDEEKVVLLVLLRGKAKKQHSATSRRSYPCYDQ
ncbi:hypothetical protein KFK09_019469 [Dendrobium nobile]|uniref:Uncharacterized protein n=1 Tax=Dendrobium nobile TaxID=94219 RepID=A0A8T3AR60_DENNO|nr:hypothetical protein KFK09_019469 [Dendrobium nobile]